MTAVAVLARRADSHSKSQCSALWGHLNRGEMVALIELSLGQKAIPNLHSESDGKLCEILTAEKLMVLEDLKKLSVQYCRDSGSTGGDPRFLELLTSLVGPGVQPARSSSRLSRPALECGRLIGKVDAELAKMPKKTWLTWIRHGLGSVWSSIRKFITGGRHEETMVKLARIAGFIWFANNAVAAVAAVQIAKHEAARAAARGILGNGIDALASLIPLIGTGIISPFLTTVGAGFATAAGAVEGLVAAAVTGTFATVNTFLSSLGGTLTSFLAGVVSSLGGALAWSFISLGFGVALAAVGAGYLSAQLGTLANSRAGEAVADSISTITKAVGPLKKGTPSPFKKRSISRKRSKKPTPKLSLKKPTPKATSGKPKAKPTSTSGKGRSKAKIKSTGKPRPLTAEEEAEFAKFAPPEDESSDSD